MEINFTFEDKDKQSNFKRFLDRCNEVYQTIEKFENPIVVHHYDADGLTSGAIVLSGLRDMKKRHSEITIKKLTKQFVEKLKLRNRPIIFVDLGGGQEFVNELNEVVIIDHHQTKSINKLQANPHLFGFDGSTELSASGTAFLVFKNRIDLAITGAVGDMQMPFIGLNKKILELAEKRGEVEIRKDLLFYGKFSRSLISFLSLNDEPYIPGISNSEKLTEDFLDRLGLLDKKDKKYYELEEADKKKIIGALMVHLSQKKIDIPIVGDNYIFPNNPNIIKDASEFSTLLNACGRNDKPEIGIGVCLKEKDSLEKAEILLAEHKKNLKQGIEIAIKQIVEFDNFYFFDARGLVRENIVGVVIGMLPFLENKKPIIAYAVDEETGGIKISSRISKGNGICKANLGDMMKIAAEKCNGIGGGHSVAAGASIPKECAEKFLLFCNEYLKGLK